ncbi:lipid transferase CIDEB isoform X1 [Lepidochelys kempii]|uniref:lipid transferase CIDEB isoform X1 n=1 Tax=Lepidochelys kempii TaxID=8472 RepID=UPI003C70393C
MDYISALAPSSLLQSVSSAGSELTRRVLAPRAPPQRPFRVCDHRRGGRTGLMAGTLQELLAKGAPPHHSAPPGDGGTAGGGAGRARAGGGRDGSGERGLFPGAAPRHGPDAAGPRAELEPPTGRGPGLQVEPGSAAPGAGHRPHHLRRLQAGPPRPLREPQREGHVLRALLHELRLQMPGPQEGAEGGVASGLGRDAGNGAAAAGSLQLHPAPPGGGGDLAPARPAQPL